MLYNNVFVEILNFPPLTKTSGKLIWIGFIPVYWSIAFVVGAAIPNFSALTQVVAAFCILQFTYTFPPLLHIGYKIKRAALTDQATFDPATGADPEKLRFSDCVRYFFAQKWYLNVLHAIYFLGALALAGLGAYAAIETYKAGFASGVTTSFTCTSPFGSS